MIRSGGISIPIISAQAMVCKIIPNLELLSPVAIQFERTNAFHCTVKSISARKFFRAGTTVRISYAYCHLSVKKINLKCERWGLLKHGAISSYDTVVFQQDVTARSLIKHDNVKTYYLIHYMSQRSFNLILIWVKLHEILSSTRISF